MVKASEKDARRQVLLVDPSPAAAAMGREVLGGIGLEVIVRNSAVDAMAVVRRGDVACVILDSGSPACGGASNGFDLLRSIRTVDDAPSVVVVTSQPSLTAAVEAVRAGAFDYLVRPFSASRLLAVVKAALAAGPTTTVAKAILTAVRPDEDFGMFVGRSKPMLAVYAIIDAAARSSASVFITGESGTGKEIAAEALHARSNRARRPFVALNCGAIPRDLMESTLFGHVKGSFTGAIEDVEGAAARADGGTLFLDELGEMDPGLQTKLLRFIQTGTYQRVGDPRLRQADIRFVAATNREPAEAIASGRLRGDLFYRLCVVHVALPPLRDRGDDVLRIAKRFLEKYARLEGRCLASLSPEVETLFLDDRWPGNVRELQNVIHSAVVLNDGEVLTAEMLPRARFGDASAGRRAAPRSLGFNTLLAAANNPGDGLDEEIEPLCAAERHYIEWAIGRCGGNLQVAARKLGISPSTIYRRKEVWSRKTDSAAWLAA